MSGGRKRVPLGVAVLVRPAGGIAVVVAQRCVDVEMVLGPGESHIEEAALLVHLFGAPGGQVRGEGPVGGVDDMDHAPLAALGRMNGGQREPVVVERRVRGARSPVEVGGSRVRSATSWLALGASAAMRDKASKSARRASGWS